MGRAKLLDLMDISCCGLNASWNSIARVVFYIYVNIDIFEIYRFPASVVPGHHPHQDPKFITLFRWRLAMWNA